MTKKFTLEATDGFYIAEDGEGILDFPAELCHDYEFCIRIVNLLNGGIESLENKTKGD